MSETKNNISNYGFILKALAIFCVICAHTPYDTQGWLSTILNNLGTIGVPVFFLIAGYYYHAKKYSFGQILKKKSITVILPWIFCGIIVYLYIVLRKGGFGLFSMLQYVIGYYSFLYYMTILMLFFVVFYFVKDSKWIILTLTFVSIGWLILQGILPSLTIIYPYLNPLNWLVYFSFGVFCQYYVNIEKVANTVSKYKWIFIVVGLLVFILPILFNYRFSYWKLAYLPFIILTFFGMFALATIKPLNNRLMVDVGKKSFSVYLLHMPIVGLSNLICIHFVVYAVRPFIVLAVTYGAVVIYSFIVRKLKISFLNNLIGVR